MTEAPKIVPDVLLDALTLLSRGNVSNRPYCQTYDYFYLCSIFLAFKRCLIAKVILFLLKLKRHFYQRAYTREIKYVICENIMYNL
jgi:hypothetical protein